jgi:hypothetical protein
LASISLIGSGSCIVKERPDISAAMAAGLADEPPFEIGRRQAMDLR